MRITVEIEDHDSPEKIDLVADLLVKLSCERRKIMAKNRQKPGTPTIDPNLPPSALPGMPF